MSRSAKIPVPIRPRKPYPERRPRRHEDRVPRAMTIAAGFRCKDGIVLCADTQISRGHTKYYEEKIYVNDGQDFAVAFAVAGDISLVKEIREKVSAKLSHPDLSPDYVGQILDEALEARLYTDLGIELLVAHSIKGHKPELLKFAGKGLHTAEGCEILGVGDSSLIRFISSNVYSPEITIHEATVLAIYIVRKAKDTLEYCGGDTNVCTVQDAGEWNWLIGPEIWEVELLATGQEKSALSEIIGAGKRAVFW